MDASARFAAWRRVFSARDAFPVRAPIGRGYRAVPHSVFVRMVSGEKDSRGAKEALA